MGPESRTGAARSPSPPLAVQARSGRKQAWDRDNTKKQALVEAVKADLPHMRARAGGYTSVDVSECGIDIGLCRAQADADTWHTGR